MMMMIGEEVGKMIAVGLIWGATNAFMRRGALLWDQFNKSKPPPPRSHHKHHLIIGSIKSWLNIMLFWQYSLPFIVNLSASLTFFALLSDTPISLAVPVTNGTTFAATAVVGMLLGEETRVGPALIGTAFIVLGVYLCVT
ncbi:hypothetical protein ACFE04_017481 [Oxalis oulophora]